MMTRCAIIGSPMPEREECELFGVNKNAVKKVICL